MLGAKHCKARGGGLSTEENEGGLGMLEHPSWNRILGGAMTDGRIDALFAAVVTIPGGREALSRFGRGVLGP